MSGEIKKGIIQSYNYTSKYEDDGIEYRQFSIVIDDKKYNAKGPKNLYLTEGASIIFEVSGTEILSGFCPISGIQWGKNAGKLKRQTGAADRYAFVKGTVLEKRKESSSSTDFSRDIEQQHRRVGYTIILEDETRFNAASLFGKPVKAGMEIAAVLEQNSAVLLLDITRGKRYGKQRPYFILFTLMIVAFNVWMKHLQNTGSDLIPDMNTVFWVVNIFLGLCLLMSIYTYVKGRSAEKFLKENLLASGIR